MLPIVVEPHEAHRLEGQKSGQEGSDQGYQGVEDGDGACDDVGEDRYAEGAA